MSLLASVNESSPGNVYSAPTDTAKANIGTLSNTLFNIGYSAATYTANQAESFGLGVPPQSVRINEPGYYAITSTIIGNNWSSTGSNANIKFQVVGTVTPSNVLTYPLNVLTTPGTLTQTMVIPLEPGLYTGTVILTLSLGETVSCANRNSAITMTFVEVA
jgi:hypothetical protein